jgi:methionyl-tRNA formyltransferase
LSRQEATVVFMGSPDFALPSLEALVESGRYRPALVVTQPDRQKGRGRRLLPTPVKTRALQLGLPVEEMSKANYSEVAARIAAVAPDLVVVVAFGIIIKEDLLRLPRHGCVNVHASLLPKYRGVSPIQAAILAGDRETGCTTMMIDAGIDTGGVLLRAPVEIQPRETAGTLSERLSLIGAELLVRTLDGLRDGSVTPSPQGESASPYTRKIKKTDGEIDWSQDAQAVERLVRAMTPWPGAYTFRGGKRLIVEEAVVADGRYAGVTPATIVSLAPLVVSCGNGFLELRRLKPEGKKSMTPEAYLAGHPASTGDVLK